MTSEFDAFDAMVESVTETPTEPDATTQRGALDTAVRRVDSAKEAQRQATVIGDALTERMGVRPELSDEEINGYVGSYARAHNDATAAGFVAASDAALDREITALRDRPDIKYFGPQAEYEVLLVWRDMLGSRPGQLETAYRLWEDRTLSYGALKKSISPRSKADLMTQKGALGIANDLRAVGRERERRYATPRETAKIDPTTKAGAMQAAKATVNRAGR